MVKGFKHFLPAILWGTLIFLMISIPSDRIPDAELLRFKAVDKVVHFALFFVFSILLAYGLCQLKKENCSNKTLLITVLATGIFYGASTEIIQFVALPDRHGSFSDFLANTIGTVFGLLFFKYIIKYRTQFRKQSN